jgi:hypothetical protein
MSRDSGRAVQNASALMRFEFTRLESLFGSAAARPRYEYQCGVADALGYRGNAYLGGDID